ncbi:hypothetical protein [Brassicibacter mesophilus]|uniref:hypothetical protein n=1 Tax=Brassicibacter mesophilus TaxID=745119 RepID=UPI003D22BCBD
MERWFVLLGIVGISAIGFIKLVFDYKKIINKINFTNEFINKYREFGNGLFQKRMDEEVYQWLRLKSSKMQSFMGSFGIASAYKPPFSNLLYKNYQILVNGLSEIRREYTMAQSMLSFDLAYSNLYEQVRLIDDCIISYLGALEDAEQDKIANLKNPTIWLREGIRFIVVFPLSFSYWSGLIKYHTYNRLSNNFFVKIVTTLVAFIGFIGSIVTIILGYEPLVEAFNKITGM